MLLNLAFVGSATSVGAQSRGVLRAANRPPEPKFIKQRFCGHDDMKLALLRDLPFSRNQPLKWADEYYTRILKKENKKEGCLDEI